MNALQERTPHQTGRGSGATVEDLVRARLHDAETRCRSPALTRGFDLATVLGMEHQDPRDPFAGRAGWFDRHYETVPGYVRFRVLREQLRAALPPPPASVLDAGCGPGRFPAALAADGYRVTSLDPSEEMLERAKTVLARHAERSRLVRGTVEEAPRLLSGESFDAVLLHAVVCYVQDLLPVLDGVAAVLRSGGVLSVVFKNRDALPFRHAAEGRFEQALRVLDDPLDAGNLGIVNRARSRGEVEDALSEAGFKVLRAAGVRTFTDLVREEPEERDVEQLVALELRAAEREPHRSVSRLLHLVCVRS